MMRLEDLPRTVGEVCFPHPIIVSGGTFKRAEQLAAVLPTNVIPEWGSIETDPSSGNGKRDYHAEYRSGVLICTTNSRGQPGPGMKYVEIHAPHLIRMYEDAGKPLILNISGRGVADTITLLERAIACGFKVIVINGACPNRLNQPMLCWDKEAVDELFARIDERIAGTGAIVLWKVSLGMPEDLLEHNRMRVASSMCVTGIVTGNTIPDFRIMREDGEPAIKTERGITAGGLGGPLVHGIALDDTEYCALRMPEGKIVMGVGGVRRARHVIRFLQAGATLVGLQSAYSESGENPRYIQSLLESMLE
jgi:dihydroorotate dehydrogenase